MTYFAPGGFEIGLHVVGRKLWMAKSGENRKEPRTGVRLESNPKT